MSRLGKANVAVLLAAYNGLRWLPQQAETILRQKGVNVTLFISVDSSSDGTEAWVDELAQSDSRVRVLPHGRVFGGAAGNFFRLLAEADFNYCDYVSFADQDDIWLEDKLARAVGFLKDGEYAGYSSNVIAFWPDGRRQLIHKAQPQKKWDYLFEAAGPGCSYVLTKNLAGLIRQAVVCNKASVEQVTLHDWFCYAFARSRGVDWYIDAQPSLLYRQHDSNQIGANSGLSAISSRIAQFSGGFWLRQGALIARILEKDKDAFVRQWLSFNAIGLLKLGLAAPHCRRRIRDQASFFILCIALALKRSLRND